MKRLFPLSILIALGAPVNAGAADWRMHPTFDGEFTHVIETPDYVYFTNRVLPQRNNLFPDYITMFRYDKEGNEVQNLSTDNCLPTTILYDILRNPEKKYILALGSDYSISFLYDNGDVKALPAYKLASMSEPKDVNSITPDAAHDNVYMATDFGYIVINDKKIEIADSRNYGVSLKSVARIGDTILVLTSEGALLAAPAASPRLSLSDYTPVSTVPFPMGLYPLSTTKCVMLDTGGGRMTLLNVDGEGKVTLDEPLGRLFLGVEYTDEGLTLNTSIQIIKIDKEGNRTTFPRPVSTGQGILAPRSERDAWYGEQRKGLAEMRLDETEDWVPAISFMAPDAPSPFVSTCMALHPTEGLLISNLGQTGVNYNYGANSPLLLSGYKDGRWKNLSAAYTAPEQPVVIYNPYGFSIDPDNPKYIYASSRHSGMARLNIEDPSDIIHFVNPSHAAAKEPGYVALLPDMPSMNSWSCSMSVPQFDSYGNLWSMYANYDYQKERILSVYCWEAADRKATKSATDIRLPKLVQISDGEPAHAGHLIPLVSSKNKNLLVFWKNSGDPSIMIVDTNGTPTDTSDDRKQTLSSITDQDGNSVDLSGTNLLYEDRSTGNVWIGYQGGVVYFDPSSVMNGSSRVNKVKVARNDGTNLADYLLNEVSVTSICVDGAGNKWFGTKGGGLVCTTSDGRTILEELTIDNSDLVSNDISTVAYNPASNSLMISTREGLCEYFLKSGGTAEDKLEVKIYPNPVRPEFSGYITIEGLRDGSLVKIVDGGGNMVKELGPVSGYSAQWDGTNMHFQRVSSGVYYIFESGGDGDTSFANVGKLLIVN